MRFRHTDTDLVRNARQQDFIRWAKDQYATGKLFTERDKLLQIFGKHSHTDKGLHSTDGLINLFDLVFGSDGNTIKQIRFPASLQPCAGRADRVLRDRRPRRLSSGPTRAFMAPTAKAKATSSAKTPASAKGHKHLQRRSPPPASPLDLADGRSQAAAARQARDAGLLPAASSRPAQRLDALLPEPDRQLHTGSEPASEYAHSYPRAYVIHDMRGRRTPRTG